MEKAKVANSKLFKQNKTCDVNSKTHGMCNASVTGSSPTLASRGWGGFGRYFNISPNFPLHKGGGLIYLLTEGVPECHKAKCM